MIEEPKKKNNGKRKERMVEKGMVRIEKRNVNWGWNGNWKWKNNARDQKKKEKKMEMKKKAMSRFETGRLLIAFLLHHMRCAQHLQ
jgi:hypothetical protein